jgi:hypothetical protein
MSLPANTPNPPPPRQLTLSEWAAHYRVLHGAGLHEPPYGGPLERHLADGDYRLNDLLYDNSPAALDLWNFLLSEEDRLRQAREAGHKLVGTMKDLGTVPVMAYALPNVTAFYPDGAWWIPCVMQMSAGLLQVADRMGIDESFCPVRAMLGAFATGAHFPLPDLLVCSTGAVCDDFSAIAQRLTDMGHAILWWEIPHRRPPMPDEESIQLPGTFTAPADQVAFVREELTRVRGALECCAEISLTDAMLSDGISQANQVRHVLAELRQTVYGAAVAPLPSLEMLIAEMLAIHFCSDQQEALRVLSALLDIAHARVSAGTGYFGRDAARIFWVNPVADIRVMNLLESCGGRVTGTEYLFCHALDPIDTDVPPMEALARSALADPMIGSLQDRADRVCRDMAAFNAEALVVSRIPGASHCATEGTIICEAVQSRLKLPTLEIEVPPVSDSIAPSLTTRIEALVETVRARRNG